MNAAREKGIIVRNFDKGDKVVCVNGLSVGVVGIIEEKFPDVESVATHVKVRISKRDKSYMYKYKPSLIYSYKGEIEKQRAGNWRLIDNG